MMWLFHSYPMWISQYNDGRTQYVGISYILTSAFLLTILGSCGIANAQVGNPDPISKEGVRQLRNATRDLFGHAWDSYMTYGFPADEVTPLTCQPHGPDYINIENTVRNDAMGNTSSTVLDNLDTLIIMERWNDLEVVLQYLHDEQEQLFEQDTIVQVFEQTIRSLGGLMSSHLLLDLLSKQERYSNIPCVTNYDGFLLSLAQDLGSRLLPAFKTSTELPVPRINLAKGVRAVPARMQLETNTAGAGSPVLEFTLLSKLTGDPSFEKYAKAAFYKIWRSRSTLDLMPMSLDPIESKWFETHTGIGASIDSFYEYAAKSAIIFDDENMWKVFTTSYRALRTHSRSHWTGMLFGNVGVADGQLFVHWIDSLGAFWTGLQVLTGQVSDAIKTHLMYWKVWNAYDSIPERVNIFGHEMLQLQYVTSSTALGITLEWYPLRPEFIESTYYLYRATRDPIYLQIGARILELLQTKFKTKCGFRGFQDVRTGEMQDRMETFVLSETLKYLYLLFDEEDRCFLHDNEVMKGKSWVFSTEAHPVWNPSPSNNDMGQDNSYLTDTSQLSSNSFLVHSSPNEPVQLVKYTMKEQKNILKRDPFEIKFSTCEVNPFPSVPFMSSAYYRMNDLFQAEHLFQYFLLRPECMGERSDFELTSSFYERYSLVQPNHGLLLQCARKVTTSFVDMFSGEMMFVPKTEVTEFAVIGAKNIDEDYTLHTHDLWIPNLANARIRFEKLQPSNVDTRNQDITPEYIEYFMTRGDIFQIKNNTRVLTENASPNSDTIFRILQINGVDVAPGVKVWTSPYVGDVCSFANPDIVLFGDYIVENLHAWW
ncbi:ER degradation-enhancing alpha-mannosidase-like protein 1 [[Candida] anglica]